MNDSIVGCVMDSLNFYKISSYVTVDNNSWDSYLSVILGAVLTFLLTCLLNGVNERKQRKKEKIQFLNQIREKILEADKYAETFLSIQMQVANSESYVNDFGKKVSAIENLFESKRLVLDDSLCNKINSIKKDMFEYQFLAMKSTVYCEIADSNPGNIMASYSQRASNAASQCEGLLSKWQKNIVEFEKDIKHIMKKM